MSRNVRQSSEETLNNPEYLLKTDPNLKKVMPDPLNSVYIWF